MEWYAIELEEETRECAQNLAKRLGIHSMNDLIVELIKSFEESEKNTRGCF